MSSQRPHQPVDFEAGASAARMSLWSYGPRAEAAAAAERGLEGFAVEADDQPLGTVAVACDERDASFIVLRGGAWNGGRSVMLPAGVVERIDVVARKVLLRCSREQIGHAPAFENDRYRDAAFRLELTAYYAAQLPSAFPRHEASARRAGAVASVPGPFGGARGGYPEATVL